MITKEQKTRLHVFIVFSGILCVIALAIFIVPIIRDRGTHFLIDFKSMSVSGLEEGATVKYQGVRIGTTEKISVNENDLNSILVQVKINRSFKVKVDMMAKLQFTGITGLKFIELYGGKNTSENLAPGGTISMGKGLGEKAEDIVKNIDTAVKRINDFLTPQNRENVSSFISHLDETATVLSEVFKLRRINLENMLINFDKASASLNQSARELERFTGKLNTALPQKKINHLTDSLDSSLTSLAARLSDKELGKTVSRLNDAIKNIEFSFVELKRDMSMTLNALRSSFEDLKSFSRRLSEDPNILIRKSKRRRNSQ